MKILVLNYRDLLHPQAGGAEVHLHRIFGRIAAWGHPVTLVASGFAGGAARECLDGMQVVRLGRELSFQFQVAARFRALMAEFDPDIVVEDLNKLPFFTPLYTRRPKFIQIHHLWKSSIFKESSAPIAAMVWLQERMIPWFYRGLPFAAVSPSTVLELQELGIPKSDIHLIYNGSEEAWAQVEPQTEKADHFLWLGRLRKYKGVWVALEAFRTYARTHPEGKIVFAGGGPEERSMREAVREWGLTDRVQILGRVENAEKQRLLRSAVALVQSSFKEGWGLTIMEAAASGTVSIASRVPGLRDSVIDGQTGWLFPAGDAQALAQLMGRAFESVAERRSMQEQARQHALGFSWEEAARLTLAALEGAVRQQQRTV